MPALSWPTTRKTSFENGCNVIGRNSELNGMKSAGVDRRNSHPRQRSCNGADPDSPGYRVKHRFSQPRKPQRADNDRNRS